MPPVEASCYGDSWEGGRPCRLSVDSWGVRVTGPDGSEILWPFDRLKLEVVGEDRDYLLISSPGSGAATPVSQVVARGSHLVPALAGHRLDAEAQNVIKAFEPGRLQAVSRRRRHIAVFLVAAALAALGGWFLLTRLAGEIAARRMPVATEMTWGKMIADAFLADRKVLHGGAAVEATQSLLSALTSALEENPGYSFTLHVVDAAMVNAVALPGGHIVVFTGLIRQAGSADELAGVLAHELQHIVRRHVVRRIAGSLGWRAIAVLVLGSGDLADLALGAGELLELSYGRGQEREADERGVPLAARAGFEASALADFFERLRKEDGVGLPEILSTHPGMEERIGIIRKLASSASRNGGKRPKIDWPEAKRSLS